MGTLSRIVTGLGLGAGAMYLLDPVDGRRRRHLLYDQVLSRARQSRALSAKALRDGAQRAQGAWRATARRVESEPVDDSVLVERVRARLGRFVSHPHSIEVRAEEGRVTLSGPILAHEEKRLLDVVGRVRGVCEVENRLEPHEQAGNIPSLQGGVPRPGERSELLQRTWTPALRVSAAAAGAAFLGYGLRRGRGLGLALGGLGAGLLGRGLANKPVVKLLGLGGAGKLVEVKKTIEIDAPVGHVFTLWINYENFPRFMSTLREVRDEGDGRSRWTVEGPAGIPLSWEAEITRLVPDRLLAWKSRRGSVISNSGVITFEPLPAGGTRVQVRLSYDPPAGALGHVAALLFGADPKSQMDEDLLRMKTFLESGRRPHDAADGSDRPGLVVASEGTGGLPPRQPS